MDQTGGKVRVLRALEEAMGQGSMERQVEAESSREAAYT
jgi:hypothetical protein